MAEDLKPVISFCICQLPLYLPKSISLHVFAVFLVVLTVEYCLKAIRSPLHSIVGISQVTDIKEFSSFSQLFQNICSNVNTAELLPINLLIITA